MDVRLLLLFAEILQSNCLDNLAINKAASQSSNLHADKWLADEAVDGDGNQKLAGNSCACTSDKFLPEAWWQVNLGKVYAMSEVKIFYTSETGDNTFTFRLSGFVLYVNLNDDYLSTTPVYSHNGGVQGNPGPPANFTLTLEAYGQYVTIYKQRHDTCSPSTTNSNFCTRFELCEVEVLGCPQKKHGSDCQSDCPENCLYDVCKISDGKCFACKVGYNGDMCDQPCLSGTYGAGCSQTCSGHCGNSAPCDVTDGTCPDGCSDGYLGSYCNITCSPGSFGASCSSSCGSCRDSATCNFINGTCPTGCGLGVMGQYCKTACSSGMYGYSCSESCSGNCYNGVTCNVQTGKCDGGCAAGWKGDKCDTACTSGTFGRNCLQNCSRNCQNETECNIVDGSCQYGCKGGWKGPICSQVCEDGTYGSGCVESCGNCINSTVCDRQTGACDSGCADGYINRLCKEECQAGYYGPGCSLECPPCNATCHHVTGDCPDAEQVIEIMTESPNSTTAIVAAVVAVIAIAIIVAFIVFFVLKMRRKSKVTKQRYSQHLYSNNPSENTGNDNAAGPMGFYSEVDKSNKKAKLSNDAVAGPSAVYAEVDKSKKINIKETAPNDVYAEVNKNAKPAQNGPADDQAGAVYSEVQKKPDKNKGKKLAQKKEPERHTNQDGLVYMDVEFATPTQNPSRTLNIDDRTEYASLQIQ